MEHLCGQKEPPRLRGRGCRPRACLSLGITLLLSASRCAGAFLCPQPLGAPSFGMSARPPDRFCGVPGGEHWGGSQLSAERPREGQAGPPPPLTKSEQLSEAQQFVLVNRLIKEGFLKQAVAVCTSMKRPSDALIRSLLMGCLNRLDLPTALSLIKAASVQPTLIHYTLAIKICTRVNAWAEVSAHTRRRGRHEGRL